MHNFAILPHSLSYFGNPLERTACVGCGSRVASHDSRSVEDCEEEATSSKLGLRTGEWSFVRQQRYLTQKTVSAGVYRPGSARNIPHPSTRFRYLDCKSGNIQIQRGESNV
jgi:hypothetical protein